MIHTTLFFIYQDKSPRLSIFEHFHSSTLFDPPPSHLLDQVQTGQIVGYKFGSSFADNLLKKMRKETLSLSVKYRYLSGFHWSSRKDAASPHPE